MLILSTIKRKKYDKYSKIAYQFAPIHFQHVNIQNPERDMLCAVDFDGDWNTKNNRKNLKKFDLIPVVYYGVAETKTHYFILYCFYHADDLTHENDLEGCLVIVERRSQQIQAMITVAHMDFWSFVAKKRLKKGKETVDGKLSLEKFNGTWHPMTKQEMDKHGLYAWKTKDLWGWNLGKDSINHTGVKYVPGNSAKNIDKKSISSFKNTIRNYVLIDILDNEGFWNKRNDETLFKKWGVFNSSKGGSAHAPWVWKDHNDELSAGLLFYDPAAIVERYFSEFRKFDRNYVRTMFLEK